MWMDEKFSENLQPFHSPNAHRSVQNCKGGLLKVRDLNEPNKDQKGYYLENRSE